MEHHFTLPVILNEKEAVFPGRLITFGYSYTFYIVADKQEIIFERDEEMNLRAISFNGNTHVSVELLEAISEALEKMEFLQTA